MLNVREKCRTHIAAGVCDACRTKSEPENSGNIICIACLRWMPEKSFETRIFGSKLRYAALLLPTGCNLGTSAALLFFRFLAFLLPLDLVVVVVCREFAITRRGRGTFLLDWDMPQLNKQDSHKRSREQMRRTTRRNSSVVSTGSIHSHLLTRSSNI